MTQTNKNDEQYLIGSMLQWADIALELTQTVQDYHFTAPDSILVFRAIKTLCDKKIDPSISLLNSMTKDIALIQYAMDCVDIATTKQGCKAHFSNFIASYTNRATKEILQKALLQSDVDISEIQTSLSALALSVTQDTEYNHRESILSFLDKINEARINKNKLTGMRTPWNRLNQVVNNLQKKRTYIIGGLKKTGKSRFAIHLTSGLLDDGHSGIWFSMEMQPDAIHTCLVACRRDINTNTIFNGNFATDKIQQDFSQEVYKYAMENIYISTKSSINPSYVKTLIKARKNRGKVDFVIIDYVQRMRGRGNGKNGRADELENIMADLSDIARDEDVALVILSQLSGEAEKEKKAPVYSYFKGSQAILECADVGIVLTDPNRGISENREYKEIDAMIIQRDGKSDVEINFNAYLQYSKFVETERDKSTNSLESAIKKSKEGRF